MTLTVNQRNGKLRKNAPKLVAAGITIALVVYIVFEILEDIFVEGGSMTSGPLIGAIISLTHNVTNTVQSWGYTGVFVLMFLESSSVPIPSEVILPFAGYLASTGQLNVWITLLLATIAGLAGSIIDYYIGLRGIESLIKH